MRHLIGVKLPPKDGYASTRDTAIDAHQALKILIRVYLGPKWHGAKSPAVLVGHKC